MKKIVSLMVASVFLFFASPFAFADEPVLKVLDKHANWTAPKATPMETEGAGAPEGTASSISFEEEKVSSMGGRPNWDGFVQETKTYDYSADHHKSA